MEQGSQRHDGELRPPAPVRRARGLVRDDQAPDVPALAGPGTSPAAWDVGLRAHAVPGDPGDPPRARRPAVPRPLAARPGRPARSPAVPPRVSAQAHLAVGAGAYDRNVAVGSDVQMGGPTQVSWPTSAPTGPSWRGQ